MKLLFIYALLMPALVSAHEAAEGPAAIGAGKAVEAYDPAKGFSLSPKAISRLGVESIAFHGVKPPAEALVRSRGAVGVYRRRQGWFSFVRAGDFQPADELVIEGAALLRVVDISLAEKAAPGAGDDHEEHHHEESGK